MKDETVKIELNGLVYEFDDVFELMELLDEHADRVGEES